MPFEGSLKLEASTSRRSKATPVAEDTKRPVRMDERLALRPAEAARALGIGERTLRQLLPILPHVRAGGTVLLPVEGLRRWLDEQAKGERARADRITAEVLAEVRNVD